MNDTTIFQNSETNYFHNSLTDSIYYINLQLPDTIHFTQAQDKTFFDIYASPIFGITGVILGVILTFFLSHLLFKRQKDYENKRVTISKLSGLKLSFPQILSLSLHSHNDMRYYEAICKIDDYQDTSLLKLRDDFVQKSFELFKDFSTIQGELGEVIGLAYISFNIDKILGNLLDDLQEIDLPHIEKFDDSIEANEVREITFKRKKEISLVSEKQIKKFEVVVDLLKNQL